VLARLPFARSFSVPDVPLSSGDIVTSIAYLIALVLFLNYARVLSVLWPQAFPRQSPLTPALRALVHVAALAAGYLALERPVTVFIDETGRLILQAIALVIAIVLLVQAALVAYRHLPLWFASLPFETASGATAEVACLHCGRLNAAAMKFCGHCGNPLAPQSASSGEGPKAA
jgi:hypothetical protein